MAEMNNNEEFELELVKNAETVPEITVFIRNAEWARSVRESMAKGIEISDKISTNAMDLVTEKANEIDLKVKEANTSIANADTATAKATTAASNADTATSKANTATTNANNATTKANTAATKADTARIDIETKLANGEFKGEPGDITNATGKDIKLDDGRTLQQFVDSYLKDVHPIGTILSTYTNVNPSTRFGGTWQAYAQGRVLVGVDTTQLEFNTVGKLGGSKTHALTEDENGEHTHFTFQTSVQMSGTPGQNGSLVYNGGNANGSKSSKSGKGTPHNNLQPYQTVYYWRRTA